MKILVMGLPGSGKTYLSTKLTKMLNAVHFNADIVRATMNSDLGFSPQDRIEHARRMGHMCDYVVASGHYAIADFVCPLPETRSFFSADFTIWLDTIKEGRYEDTNRMFVPPDKFDVRIKSFDYDLNGIYKHILLVKYN
jgi:adenylylsulfate kinase